MNNKEIQERIKNAKEAFKKKYADKDIKAARMGITAAYQRAHLYTPGSNNEDIRREWEEELERIAVDYRTQQSEERFVEDVQKLADYMNKQFPQRFNNGKDGYKEVFRIAHAQKSLSVCLKHKWIWEEPNFAIPPVCPIDGIMLKHVGNYEAWTKVNSLKDSIDSNGEKRPGYLSHLELMKRKAKEAGFDTTSEWELVVWYEHKSQGPSNNTRSNETTTKEEDGIFPVDETSGILQRGGKQGGNHALFGYRFHNGGNKIYLYVGEYRNTGKIFCQILQKKRGNNPVLVSLEPVFGKQFDLKMEHKTAQNEDRYIRKFKVGENEKAKELMESLKEPIARTIWGDEADKYLHTENS